MDHDAASIGSDQTPCSTQKQASYLRSLLSQLPSRHAAEAVYKKEKTNLLAMLHVILACVLSDVPAVI